MSRDAFLLANNGVVTLGNDIYDSYYKMEKVEHVVKIQFIAQQIGKINQLDIEEVKELLNMRDKFEIKQGIGIKIKNRSK